MSAAATATAPASYDAELEALAALPAKSAAQHKQLLKLVKDAHVRRPELVFASGMALLRQGGGSLTEAEHWELQERVFVAALDLGERDAAARVLSAITSKFGFQSVRVRRLHALDHEARGDYKDAVDIYDEILRGDPVNSYCLKRKAAVLRSLGRLEEARKQLNDYVQVYSSDAAAWQELCELYIVEESLELARFCAEELVLLEPANFFYHLQLAEILYALGGKNNYADARRYYAQSLELKPASNLRALLGLWLCLRAKPSSEPLTKQLRAWTTQRILDTYQKASSKEALALVKELVSSDASQSQQ